MGTVGRQLRIYLQKVEATQTRHEVVSTGAPPVSEAAAFLKEMTKERAMNNDLQCKVFYKKRSSEHLKRQLIAFREDLNNESHEVQVTVKSLQGDMKMAHTTNVEPEAHLKTEVKEIAVLNESAFLSGATSKADLSCLHNPLKMHLEEEAQRTRGQLQTHATQTPQRNTRQDCSTLAWQSTATI